MAQGEARCAGAIFGRKLPGNFVGLRMRTVEASAAKSRAILRRSDWLVMLEQAAMLFSDGWRPQIQVQSDPWIIVGANDLTVFRSAADNRP